MVGLQGHFRKTTKKTFTLRIHIKPKTSTQTKNNLTMFGAHEEKNKSPAFYWWFGVFFPSLGIEILQKGLVFI